MDSPSSSLSLSGVTERAYQLVIRFWGVALQTSPKTEERIRVSLEAGDTRAAAALAIEGFGPEILGFLTALVGDVSQADDVFSIFCEDVWRGLGGFEWRCSVRGWCYTVARHAAMRWLRSSDRRAARHVPLSEAAQLAERVRSETAPIRRSEVKSRMRSLREQLPVDEQLLLILRVDKDLPWSDVAIILCDEDSSALEGEDLARKAAAARKRFQLVKEKLRRMAREAGLL
jgi:RNA polymerase sigma-70 factor, ECF subfamily